MRKGNNVEKSMAPNTCPCWAHVDVECLQQHPCKGDIPSVVLQEHLRVPNGNSLLVDHLQLTPTHGVCQENVLDISEYDLDRLFAQ